MRRRMPNSEAATKLRVTRSTVGKWRDRFRLGGLEDLLDEPRPGALRQIGDDKIEEVVTRTLESRPENRTHWTTRAMGKQQPFSGYNRADLARVRLTTSSRGELQTVQRSTVCGEGAGCRGAVHESSGVRSGTLRRREKSDTRLNRTQRILPLPPGVPARQSHDYERHGVTSSFAALNVATAYRGLY